MSKISSRVLNPSRAKVSINHAISKQRPVFLWGPPGIGKSDIVHQIAEDINAYVIDVRLSLWDPTDIKGIPYFDSNQNKMQWAPPSELPDQVLSEKHDRIILFFDEMNSAPPAVMAAAYQLILNRRVGTYELPDNVQIIAAGNRESDNGVSYRMPAPLSNRFIHIELGVNFDDWFDWATKSSIHPDIVGFLQFSKKDLFDFDPKSPSRSFATPRTWEFVSDLLDDELDELSTTDLVSGAIGEGLAVKFMSHRKHAQMLPNPEDVLEGKVTKLDTSEVSAMYSLTVSMCYELKQLEGKHAKDFGKKVNNFLKFSMDNFETELVVLGLRLALTQYGITIDPDEIECFDEFYERFGKYVHAAQQG